MKMRRVWFALFCLLCLFAVALAVLHMTAAPPDEDGGFLVRDEGGLVTVYTVDGEALRERKSYEIYVNLLPEDDALQLKNGIRLHSEIELQLLLEALGG